MARSLGNGGRPIAVSVTSEIRHVDAAARGRGQFGGHQLPRLSLFGQRWSSSIGRRSRITGNAIGQVNIAHDHLEVFTHRTDATHCPVR